MDEHEGPITNDAEIGDPEVVGGKTERDLGSLFALILLFGVIGALIALLFALQPSAGVRLLALIPPILALLIGGFLFRRARQIFRRRT